MKFLQCRPFWLDSQLRPGSRAIDSLYLCQFLKQSERACMSTSTCISEFDTEVVMLKRTATYMPWLVCLSAALFFFFIFIQMNLFNAIAPALMQDFQVSAAVIGHLSAQYFYANILCAVPAGLLLDRYSTRRLLIVAMAVTIGCTYGFALSHAVWQAGLFRFVTGMMGSFCLLSCVRLAARWFKPERMALVIGIVVALAMLGGTVAQTPMTLLTDTVGWRAALMWDATSGLVLLGWIIWAVRDFPPRMAQTVLAEQAAVHEAGLWRSLQGIAKNRQNWLGGLYTSLLNLPIFLLGAMWGRMYLEQVDGFSAANASFICSMLFLGSIIGAPLMGLISDTLGRRRLPMLISAVLSLVVVLIIIYGESLSFAQLSILFFLLGLITCSQVISYP